MVYKGKNVGSRFRITLICMELLSHSEETCFSPVDIGTSPNHVNLGVSLFFCALIYYIYFSCLFVQEIYYETQGKLLNSIGKQSATLSQLFLPSTPTFAI